MQIPLKYLCSELYFLNSVLVSWAGRRGGRGYREWRCLVPALGLGLGWWSTPHRREGGAWSGKEISTPAVGQNHREEALKKFPGSAPATESVSQGGALSMYF